MKRFTWEGVKYLRSSEDVIYDIESNDAIGVWNDKKQKIELTGSEEADDEELCSTAPCSDAEEDELEPEKASGGGGVSM